jgi:hypothetical protein
MPEYVGQTNINEMERSLMRRLQSLELYMDQKYGNGQNRLNLRFEQKMVAVRGPKIPIQTRLNFNHAVIEGKRDVKPVDTLVDFLVCAGGANDRIRDKYIGKSEI